jgi:D-tagatose-1,6-bisphosphate aldolase subunit GatZ/KbaZ
LACRQAFQSAGLTAAWARVCAVVVHTGAAFSPVAVQPYVAKRLQPLVSMIRQEKHLVLEAHSTDFQTEHALTAMVNDHCGVLKVGPALTYALREALFALAKIEKKTLGARKGVRLSHLPATMERLMVGDPGFWQAYYQGSAQEQAHLRQHAFSDRIRYYWARPEAEAARQQLFRNLRRYPPSLDLVRNELPEAGAKIRDGRLANDPEAIVLDRIGRVAGRYARACRPDRAACVSR